ncbi:MAG TPA: phage terminase large subunit [Bryobacteraceae bacterium]|nr:phage terminase large subunit [Bryobacteraceae bacterium]
MLDIALQPKQLELARLMEARGPDVATWIGFGGALGGAKSGAIRRIMLARRGKYPRTIGVIMRRVLADVKENHIQKFWEEFPELRQCYNATDFEIVLPNASRIKFMYAENSQEVDRKFYGPEFFDIFIDQAEQFSEAELRTINTRNRAPGAPDGLCKMGLFFNPGGCGTEFLRRVFWLKQYHGNERASDYAFIQSYGWDNYEWLRGTGEISERDYYALSNDDRFKLFIERSQYGRKLNELPQSIRAGHLLGSFETFAGQYFAGVWDESKCILSVNQSDQLIQPWWTRWTATDWGFAHHAVHLWFASGKLSPQDFARVFGGSTDWPIDIVVVYRELVVNATAEADFATMMVDLTPADERKLIRREFLSPDAWAKRGSANTVAEQLGVVLRRHGLPSPESADDDRIGGWRLMYNGFRQTSALRGATVDAERARQGPLLLVSANCPQVISALPLLTRDNIHPGKLEDVLKTDTLHDDVGDCLRYGYKSMLDPRSKAPREVREREILDSITGDGADAMTRRAMAMRKFHAEERTIRRVSRVQRWR